MYLESLACALFLVLDTLKFTTQRLRMNILYNIMRSYNQQYNTTHPKIENTSLKSITSCNGYKRALVEYPSGYTLAKSC